MFPAKLKTVYDIIFIIILAALYNLSFSPFDFKFTIYLSLIGFFFLIRNKEKILAMKYSFIYGFFIYLATIFAYGMASRSSSSSFCTMYT